MKQTNFIAHKTLKRAMKLQLNLLQGDTLLKLSKLGRRRKQKREKVNEKKTSCNAYKNKRD